MCKSDNPTMHFNPQNIFDGMAIREEERDSLGAPFSAKEIDEVVKSLLDLIASTMIFKKITGQLLALI
jgi:hypothetical protein